MIDVEPRPASVRFDKEIGVVREHVLLQGGRKLGEAREVVVPVALDTGDAEAGLRREILQHGHGSHIRKILAAHHRGLAP